MLSTFLAFMPELVQRHPCIRGVSIYPIHEGMLKVLFEKIDKAQWHCVEKVFDTFALQQYYDDRIVRYELEEMAKMLEKQRTIQPGSLP